MPEDNLRHEISQIDAAVNGEDLLSPNRRSSVNDRTRSKSYRRASQEVIKKNATVIKESIDFDEHRPVPKRRSRRKSSLVHEIKRSESINQRAPTESDNRRPRLSYEKKKEREEDINPFTEASLLQDTADTKHAGNVKRSRRRSTHSKEDNYSNYRSKAERDSEKEETAGLDDGLTQRRRSRRRSRISRKPNVLFEENFERRKSRRESVNSERSASNDDDPKRRNKRTKKEPKIEPDKEENKDFVRRSRRTGSKRNSMSRRTKCQLSPERSSSNEDLESSYNVASSSLYLHPKLKQQDQSPGYNEEQLRKAEVESQWIALKSNADGSFERSFVRNDKNERRKNRRRQSRDKEEEEGSDNKEWPNYDSPSVTEKGSLTRIQKTNQGSLLPVATAAADSVISQTKPTLQRGVAFDPLSNANDTVGGAINESASFASLPSEEKQFFSCSSLGSLFCNDVERTYEEIFTSTDCETAAGQQIDHVASHNLYAGTSECNTKNCKKEGSPCLAAIGEPIDKPAFSISTLLENKAMSKEKTPVSNTITPHTTQVATAENKLGNLLKTDLDPPQTLRGASFLRAPSIQSESDEMSQAGSKTPKINSFFSDQELGINANRLATQTSPFPLVTKPKTIPYNAVCVKENDTVNTISTSEPNSSSPTPRSSKDFSFTSKSTGNAYVATVPAKAPTNETNLEREISYSKKQSPSQYVSDILGAIRCKAVMPDSHYKQSLSIEQRKASIGVKDERKVSELKRHDNNACDVIQCIAPLENSAVHSNTKNSLNCKGKSVTHSMSTSTLPCDLTPKQTTSDVIRFPLCDVSSVQSHGGALSREISYSPSYEFAPRMSRDQFVIEGESRDKRSSSFCSKEQGGRGVKRAGVGRTARECCSKCWKFDANRPWYLFSGKGVGWKIILSPLLLLVGPFVWVANMLNLTERIRASWENCWRCDHDEYWFSCKGKGTGLICLLIPIYLVLGPLIVIFTLLTVTFLACCGDSKPPDSSQHVSQIRAY